MLVLADDATGALECGSILASAGREVRVWLRPEPPDEPIAEYLVADTETRHVSPRAAAERIRRWAQAAGGLIYKKTDSTLRGNIAAELSALAEATNWPIHYIPAHISVLSRACESPGCSSASISIGV
ncbi:MAG: four-carbon acid sugar kinase family protein [Acidobacteria bacterium]|nr:four-carbon acid sugar kinase family protein [Acidobacteriota bacterium]